MLLVLLILPNQLEKTNYDTKSKQIEKKIPNHTTNECNMFSDEICDGRLKPVNSATKPNFKTRQQKLEKYLI